MAMKREDMRPELQELLDQAECNNGEVESGLWIALSSIAETGSFDEFLNLLEAKMSYGQFPLEETRYEILGYKGNDIHLKVTASIPREYWEEKDDESVESEE